MSNNRAGNMLSSLNVGELVKNGGSFAALGGIGAIIGQEVINADNLADQEFLNIQKAFDSQLQKYLESLQGDQNFFNTVNEGRFGSFMARLWHGVNNFFSNNPNKETFYEKYNRIDALLRENAQDHIIGFYEDWVKKQKYSERTFESVTANSVAAMGKGIGSGLGQVFDRDPEIDDMTGGAHVDGTMSASQTGLVSAAALGVGTVAYLNGRKGKKQKLADEHAKRAHESSLEDGKTRRAEIERDTSRQNLEAEKLRQLRESRERTGGNGSGSSRVSYDKPIGPNRAGHVDNFDALKNGGRGPGYGSRKRLGGGKFDLLIAAALATTALMGRNPVSGSNASSVSNDADVTYTTLSDPQAIDAGATSNLQAVAAIGGGVAAGAAALKTGAFKMALPKTLGGLAKFGLKGIPLVGAVAAAGFATYEAAGYALRGEFGKAGLRATAGVVETAAGMGGFLTYAAGSAGAEAMYQTAARMSDDFTSMAGTSDIAQMASIFGTDFSVAARGNGTTNNGQRLDPHRAPVFARQQQPFAFA